MLNLKLRNEFLGDQIPQTAISLRRGEGRSALEETAADHLAITYPTADVQTALRALGRSDDRRPIVIIGERGRGKSHILALMHHAVVSATEVENWAHDWGARLPSAMLSLLTLPSGYFAISEAVQNQEYPFLWDLLFDRHPHGTYFKGRFDNTGQYFPPRSLLEQMFTRQPTVLVLDEFQTWFDGLPETDAQGRKPRQWAYNFIQNLSELASERPELLTLVVSVLNNQTDAFRQIHRNGPTLIDFSGPTAKDDRQKLVLYRLFENRGQIPPADIRSLVASYAIERVRLRFLQLSDAERPRLLNEVAEAWPYSTELLELLADQILMSEAAQDTRDLIRILAQVYRTRGEATALITPADFFVDDDLSGVQSLIDSIATTGQLERLREIAQLNLETVRAALPTLAQRARQVISALWVRSLSPGRQRGGTRTELQLDVAVQGVVDENTFIDELNTLVENSINIHGENTPEGRLYFDLKENARSKVKSTAKNDRLWQAGGGAGGQGYPGEDVKHIRATLRHLLSPESRQLNARAIVLGPNWKTAPWNDVEEADNPAHWTDPVLVVIPAALTGTGVELPELGQWLATHILRRRNTARFLLLGAGARGLFDDPELIFQARCSFLTSSQQWGREADYRDLHRDFDNTFRNKLKARYTRFGLLRSWDFRNPERCEFDVEQINLQNGDIPTSIEQQIKSDLFDATEFEQFIRRAAGRSDSMSKVLDDLAEPPATPEQAAIPYLGDKVIYEEILRLAGKGLLALNVSGVWVTRPPDALDDNHAHHNVRSRAFRSGNEMRAVQIAPSEAAGVSGVMSPTPIVPPITSITPHTPPTDSTLTQPPLVSPSDLGAAPPPPPAVPRIPQVRRSENANSGLNLMRNLELWGVPPQITLAQARLEFQNLTPQQLRSVLQGLPPSLRALLEITYTDNDQT